MTSTGKLAIRTALALGLGAVALVPGAALADTVCEPSVTVSTPSVQASASAPPIIPALPAGAVAGVSGTPATTPAQPYAGGTRPVSTGSGAMQTAPPPSSATQGAQQPPIMTSTTVPVTAPAASMAANPSPQAPVAGLPAAGRTVGQGERPIEAAPTVKPVVQPDSPPVTLPTTMVPQDVIDPGITGTTATTGATGVTGHGAQRDPVAEATRASAGLMAISVLGGLAAALMLLAAALSRRVGPGGPLRLRGA